jgi:hypothetical protein
MASRDLDSLGAFTEIPEHWSRFSAVNQIAGWAGNDNHCSAREVAMEGPSHKQGWKQNRVSTGSFSSGSFSGFLTRESEISLASTSDVLFSPA